MSKLLLGVGSNIDREKNIRSGVQALRKLFGALSISPIYETHPVGFDGSNFLNFVVAVETELPLEHIADQVRKIELAHGRQPDAPKFSPRSLDIDILTYGDACGEFGSVCLPRKEILTQAFVLKPLSDIEPQLLHPLERNTYSHLWAAFSGDREGIWLSDFELSLGEIKA